MAIDLPSLNAREIWGGGSLTNSSVPMPRSASPVSVPSESRQARLQEDTHYRVLQILQRKPDISQRDLAKELGISLGAINYCLKALVQKGQIKIHNFQNSNHKLGYTYLLTPQGMIEKSRITKRFLERKLREYEYLKREIELLSREVVNDSDR